MTRVGVEFELNGRRVSAWVRPEQTVLEVLRDETGATEVKYGCGEGVCGTCTVLLDGEAVNSCLMLAAQIDGRSITTLRGLARDGEEMHPLQQSFLEYGGSQCGFCTPGMILMAYALLKESKAASREEIREVIAGNLCRCTGYTKIVDAVESYVHAGRTHQPSAKVAGAEGIGGSDVS